MTRRKSSTVTLLIRLSAAFVSSSSPSTVPFSPLLLLSFPSRLISTPRWSNSPNLGRAVDNTKRVITPFFVSTCSTSSLPSPPRVECDGGSSSWTWGVPSTGIECEMIWPEESTSPTVREYRIWPLLYAVRLSVPGSRASSPPPSWWWAHAGSGIRSGRGILNVCDVGNGGRLVPSCSLPASECIAGGGGYSWRDGKSKRSRVG